MRARKTSFFKTILHYLGVVWGASFCTTALFFIVPLIQEITKPPEKDLILTPVDFIQPQEEQVQEEPEEEEPEEEEPEELPQLDEEAPPLDLAQLELALSPGAGDGWLAGDFSLQLNTLAAAATGEGGGLFNSEDLDQEPRPIYQPSPVLTPQIRKKSPGTVWIIFIVDKRGRVTNPQVAKSTDTVFNKAALNAVKKWKFEPGKRKGESVEFRMRVPVTFPKTSS